MADRRSIAIWLSIVASVLVLAGLLLFGNVRGVLGAMAGLSAWRVVMVLLVVTFAYGLRFVKWHLLAKTLGLPIGPVRSVQAFLSGLMMVVTPAKLGELWKSVLLVTDGIPVSRSLPAVVLERVLDFAAVCILGGIGLAVLTGQTWGIWVVLAFFAAVLGALRWRGLWHRIFAWMATRPRLAKAARFGVATYDGAQVLLTPRPLILALSLALTAWALEGIVLGLLVEGLGVHVDLASAVGAFCLGTMAGVASFLPGGLGPTEAGMVALLLLAGVPSDKAVAATILVRVCTLGYGALVGAVASLVWSKPYGVAPSLAAQDGGVMDAERARDTLEHAFDRP
jgi:uncharacterized protein (TIRG00374 family)